jgi:hypothetical protein
MTHVTFMAGICLAVILHAPALCAPAGTGLESAMTSTPVPDARGGDAGRVGRESLFEFSPAAGFMGGSALIGLRASMNYHPVTLELSAEQVMGIRATLYPLSLNVVLDLADSRKTVPYGIVGGGLFLTAPTNSVGDQVVSSVGLSFGGGLRYYFLPNLGIRFETKQLFTRIDNRQDNRKELLIFQSTSLGVIFAFG